MPDKEKEQLRIEPWNYDLQEAKRRLRTSERIVHLKKLIETILPNSADEERESIYFDILFIKILSDYGYVRLQTTINLNTEEFLSCINSINKKYNNILSPKLTTLTEDHIFRILRELQRFDFSDLDIGRDQKKGFVVLDNDLEFIIFGKKYGVRLIESKLFECLGLNKKSRIFCNTMEMELFSFLFFTSILPENITLCNSYDNVKKAVIFGLLYKFINKVDNLFNIITISDEIKLSSHDILILNDETILENNSLETEENIKLIISNFKNSFLTNKTVNNILTKFGVIYNIDYPVINEHGNIERHNGLLAQKYFNHRSGLLNALDKMKLKTLEKKKSQNLSKNILSLTINYITATDNGNYYYFGGLKKEDVQIKQMDGLKVENIERQYTPEKLLLDEVDTLFDYLRFDNLEAVQKIKKFQNGCISFDLRNNRFYEGVFELNLPTKQDILNNNILHPFFYRREFLKQRNLIEEEKHSASDEIIDTILFGKEYHNTVSYQDNLFLDKNEYIAVVNSETIRFGNFPDITKVVFAERKTIALMNMNLIKENDILMSFKNPDNNHRVKIAWCIAPKILDGALLGKNTIAIRPDSITVSPFQYVEFLNLLSTTGLLSQISEIINLSDSGLDFEKYFSEFIRSYFLNVPFPHKIKDCFEGTSWLKKKVSDTYFGLLTNDHRDINELFQSILKGTDAEKGINCYPAASLWQKAYLTLLWEYNKKPEKIIMISNHNANSYKDLLLNYFSSLDIYIEDVITKNKNLKNTIRDFFSSHIESVTSSVIQGDFKNCIFLIFCDNVNLLSYYYENIKNITGIKSIYFVYTKESATEEIFDEEYDKILKFFETKQIEIKDRVKLVDIQLFLRNPFHIEKKFLSSLLNYKELTVTDNNRAQLFSQLSNILKEYADHIISHHNYYDQSAFFFLESNHFANKAMELKIAENISLAKKAEWEIIIDQLAHSLNTNIGAARNSIRMLADSLNEKNKQDLANKSDKYLTEVADLVELTLSSLKVDVAKNVSNSNLSQIIEYQINVIREGIDTLRFSNINHKMNVKNMIPVLELDNTIMLQTYIRAAELIIKDLLKNAFRNTNQEKPFVKIKTFLTDDETCILSIENNISMSPEWVKRINDDVETDELKISKTQAVGMKVVRKWNEKLFWKMNVAADEVNNFTITTLTIPVKWKNSEF